MLEKKEITNQQFEEAYLNQDNKKIIQYVLNQYRKRISFDDARYCGMKALWRCLQYHDDNQQKFTSSLVRFLHWECCRQIAKNKSIKKKEDKFCIHSYTSIKNTFTEESIDSSLNKYLDQLDEESREIIIKKFYCNKSLIDICNDFGYTRHQLNKKLGVIYEELKQMAGIQSELDFVV